MCVCVCVCIMIKEESGLYILTHVVYNSYRIF